MSNGNEADLDQAAARAMLGLHDLVRLIERQLRTAGGAETVDLDAADDELRKLAARAEQGRAVRAALLPSTERHLHTARVEQCKALRRSVEVNTAIALGLSATLADTAYGSPEHAEAAAEFRERIKSLDDDRLRLAHTELAAVESAETLDQDDARRTVYAPDVGAGESASEELDDRLRERISGAIARGALLPVWFTTVLGHHPPAEDTERWVRTATSLLAYRLTYAVTDPIVALGPPYATDRRGDWRRDLDETLHDLRS